MGFKITFLTLLIGVLALSYTSVPAVATCQDCASKNKAFYCPTNEKCYSHHATCAIGCKEPCEDTRACQGCFGGYNCSCGQCAEAGYTYWCPLANECYGSLATCMVSCGHEANCFKSDYCAPPSSCSPSQATACTSEQTCCVDNAGNSFCAPYPDATCCQVGTLTCPQDYVCYPPDNKCLPSPPAPPAHCDECQEIVKSIEEGSCAQCENLFPKYKWLCDLINKLGFCTWIEKKGLPPLNVCEMIGFCGLEGCACGYCRPQLYGQWCLSLPNRCPKHLEVEPKSIEQPVFQSSAERDAHYGKAIGRVIGHLEAQKKEEAEVGLAVGGYCLDGMCNAAHLGCCLTCA